MAKLPFIVEPRLAPIKEVIGTEDSGKIEIERRGFLTAAEKAFSQAQVSGDDSTTKLVGLVRRIGGELKIDMQKAYEAVTECMTGEGTTKLHTKINQDYSEEIAEIMGQMAQQASRAVLMNALCMLLYRVNPEFEVEDLSEVHPDLIEALAALYDDEERRSTSRLQAAVESDEVLDADAEGIDALEKK